MKKVDELKKHLKKGKVYRREELARYSTSVDRHLQELVKEGTLRKVATGLYAYPKDSEFGKTPPAEKELVKSYLRDERFLLTSPNAFNALGVGTTQLYNTQTVYNHKRDGHVRLGNQTYRFVHRANFPRKLTTEFLMVDLVNSLDDLAEDTEEVLEKVKTRLHDFDQKKMRRFVREYGTNKTRKLLTPLLHD